MLYFSLCLVSDSEEGCESVCEKTAIPFRILSPIIRVRGIAQSDVLTERKQI